VNAAPSEAELDRLASALERAFPDARPVRPLAPLGRGFRSVAVETPGGVVFRLGLSPDAAGDYAREWRTGGFLSAHLGTLVPEPRWYAEPCADFPHGTLGYRKLPGRTPAWGAAPGAAFARDLGAFMAKLHHLPAGEARAAGVPEVDSYRRLLGARDVVLPVLAGRLEAGAFARVEAWWAALAADGRLRADRLAVCHHDLWHANLLRSDEGRLSGVLDLAHVEIGDPAHDFAAPCYFGDAAVAVLLDAYRAAGGRFDEDDAYRARRFYEGREFGGLAWAVEHDDEAEIEEAIGKIVRGPVLGAAEPRPRGCG
jgi:aminoglycoside phosphotransferase (APT) family kinase protein